MANSWQNHLAVSGEPEAVDAFVADATGPGTPLNHEFLQDSSVDRGVSPAVADILFSSRWRGSFEEVASVTARHPRVVAALAAVEPGNGNALAAVYSAGREIGRYEMPADEFDELYGQEGEEQDVIDSLFSTVAGYEHDALEALSAGHAPAP